MKTSIELRAILAALESDLEAARAAFVAAQTAHRAALREEIETGKKDLSAVTASALQASQDEHARCLLSRDLARDMLAEVLKREAEEAKAAARADIDARLAQMDALARDADEDVHAFVGKIRRLLAMETEVHRDTRNALGRAPWRSPVAYSALRLIASALTTMANGVEPDLKPFVALTAADARKNIEGVTRE